MTSPLSIMDLGLAFIHGIGIILSPCILPVLPIFLCGMLPEERNRPIGIILGFIVSFSILAMLLRQILNLLAVDEEILFTISCVFLILMSLSLLSEKVSSLFAQTTQKLADYGQNLISKNRESSTSKGLVGGIMTGCVISLIWTPCAGPLLGSALTRSAAQVTDISAMLFLLTFSIGVSVPMLFVMLTGRQALNKLSFLKNNMLMIRRCLGILVLSIVVMHYL